MGMQTLSSMQGHLTWEQLLSSLSMTTEILKKLSLTQFLGSVPDFSTSPGTVILSNLLHYASVYSSIKCGK